MAAQTARDSADKVKTPFSRQQRNQLLAWSKRAKEENLLPPFERKILYEGGHYNYIFVSRLNRLSKTLEMLVGHIDDESDLVREIKNVGYCCYLEAKSEAGDPEAQYSLADALYYGLFDLDENEERALYWMAKASELGNPEAECELANWYCFGLCGLEEDEQKALKILEGAIERGSAGAQDLLAGWYQSGISVEQDFEKAYDLFSKASSSGLDDGTFHLAQCYEDGEGTKIDPGKAFEIIKPLARSGYGIVRVKRLEPPSDAP